MICALNDYNHGLETVTVELKNLLYNSTQCIEVISSRLWVKLRFCYHLVELASEWYAHRPYSAMEICPFLHMIVVRLKRAFKETGSSRCI